MFLYVGVSRILSLCVLVSCVCSAWQQHDVQELCRVMFDALEQKWKQTEQVREKRKRERTLPSRLATLILSQWEPSPQSHNKGPSVMKGERASEP